MLETDKNPRYSALMIIHKTITEGAYPNLLYKDLARGFDDRDRKFITMLVNDTLANMIHIDYILQPFIAGKSVKPIIKNILRLGIDQMVFIKTPPAAAINESVNLTKEIHKPMLGGFVNAVLRNIAKCDDFHYPDFEKDPLLYTSILESKPMWLLKLWTEQYGQENAINYAKGKITNTTIRKNIDKFQTYNVEKWFEQKDYTYKKSPWSNDLYTLDSSYDIQNSTAFKRGVISIQGIGSYLACLALDPKPNTTVLDACAAPGGKTLNIAERMGEGLLVACDVNKNRLDLITSNLSRGKYEFVRLRQANMAFLHTDMIGGFDAVLVDAPCSGLGVINAKPDILLNKTIDQLYELSHIQYKILCNCANYVKSGGTLVYSTCTINKIENDNVVEKFLKNNPDFIMDDFSSLLPPDKQHLSNKGVLQLNPYDDDEGFFVAKFKKL